MNENTRLDLKVVQQDRWAIGRGYRFKTFAELSAEPVAKRWLIKNIFARGETSAWIAPPGAMKSALMADAAVAIAGGLEWHGYRNKGASGVVYFAVERADLVMRRLLAHGARLGLDNLPIVVSNQMVDLTAADSFKKVVDTIRHASETTGLDTGFAIFDTHSKIVAAGGGDENSAKDQNLIFANLQRVKASVDVHVALVGHTGKDESRGARGSNALLGDVDVMVTIESAGEIKTAKVTKANDAPEGPLFSFKSEIHDFGPDEDGDPRTVNVVSADSVECCQVANNQPRLTENQEAMLRLLRDAGAAGLSTADWNSRARQIGIGVNRKATLHNLKSQLRDRNLVREYSDIWHAQT